MRLAISQIILGALVAVFSLIVTIQAFPTEFTLPVDESGIEHALFTYPPLTLAHVSAFLALFLGLAVVGCGIAQLIKARGSARGSKRAKAR
jgi:hypothetical protein